MQTKTAHHDPWRRRCLAPQVALTRPRLLRFALHFAILSLNYTTGSGEHGPQFLTGGPGAAPGGVASKNGWGHMRVLGESISYSRRCLSVCAAKMAVYFSKKSLRVCRGESRNELRDLKLGGYAMRGAVPCLSADLTTYAVYPCRP